jgi:hypothetical protein
MSSWHYSGDADLLSHTLIVLAGGGILDATGKTKTSSKTTASQWFVKQRVPFDPNIVNYSLRCVLIDVWCVTVSVYFLAPRAARKARAS